ncbi:MAG: hypothetical protein RL071_1768 [Pseudomonadota bacterium]
MHDEAHGPMAKTGPDEPAGGDIRASLDAVLADRSGPEARALFLTLSAYVERRAAQRVRARYADLLGAAEVEELVGEVMVELISGALGNFRGEGLHSLLAFVRCITDRVVWRAAQRRLRERAVLDGPAAEDIEAWSARAPEPPLDAAPTADCPMPQADMDYLRAILAAGGRARFATAAGVSRAAVTQRVQRIKARLERMSGDDQELAQAWLHQEAARAASAR